MSVQLDAETLLELAEAQWDELSPKTHKKVDDAKKKLKSGQLISGSTLGLGGNPPTLSQLGGVACREILRTQVLSFATLRQIRFGKGAQGDAALRAVLAALAIDGVVRANAELYIRANCHLEEVGPAATAIDQRYGKREDVDLPDLDDADALLARAIDEATRVAGLEWNGQILQVAGNPKVIARVADAESDEE
jgi:CRISPR-associated protein Csb1